MVQASTAISVTGLLIFGTLSSILSKVVYQTEGEGLDGHKKLFKKPWASTALMFFAMVFCLPIAWIASCVESRRKKIAAGNGEREPLLDTRKGNGSDEESRIAAKPASFKDISILALPMLFDLTATIMMSIGLLYVAASVYQMLRGAEILFSAIFVVCFLKRSLTKFHYGGISCCLVGIAMVGASSLLSPGGSSQSSDAGKVLLGMILIIVAQAVQAAQVTVEDYAMSHVGLAPLQVVGYEGVLGCIALAILLTIVQYIPGTDGEGLHEDSLDSIHMITHSIPPWAIPAVLIANSMALLLYNVSGMFVTEELGAVSRTVFESARTLFVWLGDLLLYYTPLGFGRLGERWDQSSYLQAAGFAVLVAGTLIYGHGDERQEKEEKAKHDADTHAAAGKHIKRPAFKFMHTIRASPARTLRQRRWRRSINAALATVRLQPDPEQQGQQSSAQH